MNYTDKNKENINTDENKENINSNINIPKTQRQINSEIYKNLRDNVPQEHKHKIMSVYNDILESNKLMKELPTDWDEEKHKKERKSYYSKFQNFINYSGDGDVSKTPYKILGNFNDFIKDVDDFNRIKVDEISYFPNEPNIEYWEAFNKFLISNTNGGKNRKRRGTKRKGAKGKGAKGNGTKRRGTKRKGAKGNGTKRKGTKRHGTKGKGTKRK